MRNNAQQLSIVFVLVNLFHQTQLMGFFAMAYAGAAGQHEHGQDGQCSEERQQPGDGCLLGLGFMHLPLRGHIAPYQNHGDGVAGDAVTEILDRNARHQKMLLADIYRLGQLTQSQFRDVVGL